jgi:uncharacterized membrane protein HdeD (DUF308 family)
MIQRRGVHFIEALSLIVLGIAATILPNYFTFKLEKMLGIIFVASGCIQLLRVFLDRMQARSVLYFMIALLCLGLYILDTSCSKYALARATFDGIFGG